MPQILLILLLLIGLTACFSDGQDADTFKNYEGPISESYQVDTRYSDSAIVRLRLRAAKQLNFENGNLEFPDGIYVEFFENDSTKSSTIQADQGYYDREKNLYTATGKVIVKNLKTKETLRTEVLYWNRSKHEIYTDRYVEIETEGDVLMGEGLTSDEQFISWRILKPTGTLPLNN